MVRIEKGEERDELASYSNEAVDLGDRSTIAGMSS